MAGAWISSSHFSLLFPFFCFKYSFLFFFVNSCLSRIYSFHSNRVSLAGPNFCRFRAVSPFLLFIYFAENFVSSVQFCSFIFPIAYCFIFPKFWLLSHRVILKTTNTFKNEIRFCSFRIWQICRQIPLPLINVGRLSMELSQANVAYSFVWVCNSAQSRSQHWSRSGGWGWVEGRGTGKIVCSCLKFFWNRSLKSV